jgi:hypothetical protein
MAAEMRRRRAAGQPPPRHRRLAWSASSGRVLDPDASQLLDGSRCVMEDFEKMEEEDR